MNYLLTFFFLLFVALPFGFAQNTKGDKPAWLPNSVQSGRAKPIKVRQGKSGKTSRPTYSNSPRKPKAATAAKEYPFVRPAAKQPSQSRPVYQPLYSNDVIIKKRYKKSARFYKKSRLVIVRTPQMKRVRKILLQSAARQAAMSRHSAEAPRSFSRPFRRKVWRGAMWGKYKHIPTAVTTDLAGMPLRRKNFVSPSIAGGAMANLKGRNFFTGKGPRSSSKPFRGKVWRGAMWGKYKHIPTAITTDLAGMPLRRKNFVSPSIAGGAMANLKGRNFFTGKGPRSSSKPFRGEVRQGAMWGKHKPIPTAITTDLAGMPLRRKNFASPPLTYPQANRASSATGLNRNVTPSRPSYSASGIANRQGEKPISQRGKSRLAVGNLAQRLKNYLLTGTARNSEKPLKNWAMLGKKKSAFAASGVRMSANAIQPKSKMKGKNRDFMPYSSPIAKRKHFGGGGLVIPIAASNAKTKRQSFSVGGILSSSRIPTQRHGIRGGGISKTTAVAIPQKGRGATKGKLETVLRAPAYVQSPYAFSASLKKRPNEVKTVLSSGMSVKHVGYVRNPSASALALRKVRPLRKDGVIPYSSPIAKRKHFGGGGLVIPIAASNAKTKRQSFSVGGILSSVRIPTQRHGIRIGGISKTTAVAIPQEGREATKGKLENGLRAPAYVQSPYAFSASLKKKPSEALTAFASGMRVKHVGYVRNHSASALALLKERVLLKHRASKTRLEAPAYVQSPYAFSASLKKRPSEAITAFASGMRVKHVGYVRNHSSSALALRKERVLLKHGAVKAAKLNPLAIDFVRYPHSDKDAVKGREEGNSYDNNGSRLGNFFSNLFSRKVPGRKDKPEKLSYDKNERKLWKDLYE